MSTVLREQSPRPRYDFDRLRHGDAIEVTSKISAREMFRRWKRAHGRRGRLVASREHPQLLFFIDDSQIDPV